MATAITEQLVGGPYEPSSNATPLSTLTWAAADATNGNVVVMSTGRCLVLFRNSGASTRTVTVPSSFDPYGRKADIAATNLAAGAIFGRIFEARGWEQTLGGRNLEFTCSHAEVLVAAIAL